MDIPKELWDLLVKLAGSYHGNFEVDEDDPNRFYSTESVLCLLNKKEHDLLNSLFE